MIKLEVLPTSSKKFECQKSVNQLTCKKCSFSSHVLPSLIQHKEAGCGNKTDNSNFLRDAYKCRKCEFVSCSYIITSRHETRRCLLDAPGCTNRVSRWICSHCDFSISYKSADLDEMFECEGENCNDRYAKLEELKEHATFVHLPHDCLKFFFANEGVNDTTNHQIEICARDQKLELDRHRIDKHSLVECNRRTEGLSMTKQTEVHNEKCLFCDNCAYKSKFKHRLRQHMKKHQRTPVVYIKWFEREECDLKNKLNKHTPTEHIKWFECQECPYKAKTQSHVYKHKIYKHTPSENIKWFECEECSYKGKLKTNLNQHRIRRHIPSEKIKWSECKDCGYRSKTKVYLKRHTISNHTPADDIKWFECRECEFKTKTKVAFNGHQIRKHTPSEEIKWFQCQKCVYKGKTKVCMRLHTIRMHSPADVIQCHKCGNRYKNKCILRRHIMKKHTVMHRST